MSLAQQNIQRIAEENVEAGGLVDEYRALRANGSPRMPFELRPGERVLDPVKFFDCLDRAVAAGGHEVRQKMADLRATIDILRQTKLARL